MSYSANEYQALCRKAARGAGLPWGYAEDVGFAARYLAEFGLDDGVSFSLLLDQFSPESVLIKALTLCDLERDFEAEIILDEIEKTPVFPSLFDACAWWQQDHSSCELGRCRVCLGCRSPLVCGLF